MGIGVPGERLITLPGTGEPGTSRAPAGCANAFSISPASATACCFGVPGDDGDGLVAAVAVPVAPDG
jgi:hypothetical protein